MWCNFIGKCICYWYKRFIKIILNSIKYLEKALLDWLSQWKIFLCPIDFRDIHIWYWKNENIKIFSLKWLPLFYCFCNIYVSNTNWQTLPSFHFSWTTIDEFLSNLIVQEFRKKTSIIFQELKTRHVHEELKMFVYLHRQL